MQLSKEKQGQVWMPQEKPSKQSKIVAMLAVLGIRRQAKLEPEDYQVYAADLEQFELVDIQRALEGLGLLPRKEFQPAFPEVGAIIEAIRAERKTRLENERMIKELDEYKELKRRRKENPEEFMSNGDWKEILAKCKSKFTDDLGDSMQKAKQEAR